MGIHLEKALPSVDIGIAMPSSGLTGDLRNKQTPELTTLDYQQLYYGGLDLMAGQSSSCNKYS